MTADLADEQVAKIRAAFDANRSKMTLQLARELGVPEADVVRALPDGLSVELDAARAQDIIRSFEKLEKVHVIVSNAATTIECFGEFGNFSVWHDFLNVQSKTIDMHIRFKELRSIFAVRKPGHMDGVMTISFQFFDPRGSSAFKVFLTFGTNAPTPEREALFNEIVGQFRAG